MAEISVVIPAYNAENTIRRTVASVLAQTFMDWELILIDDGSTDGTVEQVEAINDHRIKVYSFKNAGQAEARNRGIELSSGEFVAFLDADDLWTPDKLASQREALIAQPQAGLVYSWAIVLDEQGYVQNRQTRTNFSGNVFPKLLKANFIYCGSVPLLRRNVVEAMGYFDASLTPVEDWDYWLRVAAEYPFAVVPRYQTYYCRSAHSSSAEVDKLREQLLAVIEKVYREAPATMQRDKNQTLAFVYYYLAGQYLNYQPGKEGLRQARVSLFKALRLQPSLGMHIEFYLLGIKLLLTGLLPRRWVDRCVRDVRKFRSRNSKPAADPHKEVLP